MGSLPGDLVFLEGGDDDIPYMVISVVGGLIHVINEHKNDELVTTVDKVIDVLPMMDIIHEYDDVKLFLSDIVDDIEDTELFIKQLKEAGGEISVESENIKIKITYESNKTTKRS